MEFGKGIFTQKCDVSGSKLLSSSRPGTSATRCAVAVRCSVLQCVAVCRSVLECPLEIAVKLTPGHLGSTMCCCSVLQCVSVGCSTLQCVAVSKIAVSLAPRLPGNTVCCCSVLQHVAVSPAHSSAVLI